MEKVKKKEKKLNAQRQPPIVSLGEGCGYVYTETQWRHAAASRRRLINKTFPVIQLVRPIYFPD